MRLPLLPRELHDTDRPSVTAQWTTVGRALELHRPSALRIVTDEYAPTFLTPAGRALVRGLVVGGPAVRAAERHEAAGLSAYALCRHRFIDDHLAGALGEGIEQVLILGAGYDSRAYRFATVLAGRPVSEVDLAPLSRRKAAIVASRPDLFGHATIRRVEIDFRTESLPERLLASGFAVGARTFVVWEGVSPYLSAEAVSATLVTLQEICGPGTVLAMDFFHHVDGARAVDTIRRVGVRAIRLIGEPVTFALPPDSAPDFLGAHGFEIADRAEGAELAARYSTDDRPTDRALYVLAARLR